MKSSTPLWPYPQNSAALQANQDLYNKLASGYSEICRRLYIKEDLVPYLDTLYLPLARYLQSKHKLLKTTLVVGINGAQGSGKSTLAELLSFTLHKGYDLNVAVLSMDDIYKTRQEREQMARDVHPLFITRGVPGTHDTQMGMQIIEQAKSLGAGDVMSFPAFDKGNDDRLVERLWPNYHGEIDILLFEGWCVGVGPQEEGEVKKPVNLLEKNEDKECIWRTAVNEHLKTDYKDLFDLIDCLLFLKIPSLDCVLKWRGLQERKLIKLDKKERHLMATKAKLQRFIAHYERLTKYQLNDVSQRADLVFKLGLDHQVKQILNPSKI